MPQGVEETRERRRTSGSPRIGDDLDGYTINFVDHPREPRPRADARDAAGRQLLVPALGLRAEGPDDRPYADHEEVYEAGDAFYMPPGHTPAAEAGTEFVMFSPADEFAADRRRDHGGDDSDELTPRVERRFAR